MKNVIPFIINLNDWSQYNLSGVMNIHFYQEVIDGSESDRIQHKKIIINFFGIYIYSIMYKRISLGIKHPYLFYIKENCKNPYFYICVLEGLIPYIVLNFLYVFFDLSEISYIIVFYSLSLVIYNRISWFKDDIYYLLNIREEEYYSKYLNMRDDIYNLN